MRSEANGARAPEHEPVARAAFFSITLRRDPEAAFAAVSRILAEHLARPDVAIELCSEWIDGFGVESAGLADGGDLLYVNKGDAYDATLCYVAGQGFFVSCWADVVEAAEREREQDGERRCAYCSEWSDDGEACSGCGRDPATGQPWPEPLRHVRLDTGHELRTWDTGRTIAAGMMTRTRIGYELRDPAGVVLFRGEDFGPGAATADDSDEALRALLGFLTLRPGDTDRDFFDGYSVEQLAFAESSECEQLAWLYSEDGPGGFVEIDADGEVSP